jgi:mRNA-degrading endonuclease RelE of RelBE toxin-antitoxin system
LYLEKIIINGLDDIYIISNVRKEFEKAVNEAWKEKPPWERFQKKLIADLAVLSELKERAIDLQQFEKLSGEKELYSIRHPETRKNIRVVYTIDEHQIILLTAFLEKNDGDYLRAIRTARKRLEWLNS